MEIQQCRKWADFRLVQIGLARMTFITVFILSPQIHAFLMPLHRVGVNFDYITFLQNRLC